MLKEIMEQPKAVADTINPRITGNKVVMDEIKLSEAEIKNIKKIINEEYIRNAYKNLELKYFSIHWRIFYFFIKNKMSFCSYLMLSTIEFLRAKI